MDWGYRASVCNQFDFKPSQMEKRNKFIEKLKIQKDLKCIEPKEINIFLPGCKENVNIIVHDFNLSFVIL